MSLDNPWAEATAKQAEQKPGKCKQEGGFARMSWLI
jgi:hypothetical protein